MERTTVGGVSSIDFNGVSEIDDVEDCMVFVTFAIGPGGSDGADNFDFRVATVAWVSKNLPFWGMQGPLRHPTLVVERFDWDAVDAAVESRISDVLEESGSWADFARTFGGWEYLNGDGAG
jgi:hypothetical protein